MFLTAVFSLFERGCKYRTSFFFSKIITKKIAHFFDGFLKNKINGIFVQTNAGSGHFYGGFMERFSCSEKCAPIFL